MLLLLKTNGDPNCTSSSTTAIFPIRPTSNSLYPGFSCPVVNAFAAYTVRYPRSIVFHNTTLSTTPACTYGLFMLGNDKPVTFTSVRPDCCTASAAPGTAGAAIAMINFTFG